jgi:hypothetical protein
MQLRPISSLHIGDIFLYGGPPPERGLRAYRLAFIPAEGTGANYEASPVAEPPPHNRAMFLPHVEVITSGIPDDGR